jgi:hypothetical protein
MPKTFKNTPSADEIAERATRGEDISAHFTNKFTVVRPARRVNVDFTARSKRAARATPSVRVKTD